jgi:hypothetical protein
MPKAKDFTSKKGAKKLARKLRRSTKRFDRFNDAMNGGSGNKGGGGPSRATAMEGEAKKRTRRGKRGKGGGGEGKGSARSAAKDLLQKEFENPTTIEQDPRFEEERADIKAALEASRGKLFELDPETQAKFEEKLAASQALAERRFGQQRDTLLTRLFGQGRTEGQLAGTMGGQLIGDQELVMQQMGAANSQEQLQAQFHLGAENLQSLGMQSANLDSGRAAALQNSALNEQARATNLGAATSLETAGMSADAAVKQARIGAAAQVKSANIQAAASRANAMASLSASKYATNASLLTNMFGQESRNAQFGQDLGFRNRSLDLNAELTREGFANDQKLAQMQIQAQKDMQPSFFEKALGMAASGAASYFSGGFAKSDEELKENIRVISDAVEKINKLDGVQWNWLGSPDMEAGGVIAQQVQEVLPEAVTKSREGHLMVDYNAVIGLLVQAVKELSNG